jgi:hypothetical protein
MFMITWPTLRAQLLRLGGKGKDRVDLPLREQLGEVAVRSGNPVDVLVRVEPDMSRHDRQVQVPGRAEVLDTDPPAL